MTTVYHTRRGLDTLLHPERHDLIAPYERPVLERDVEYYTDARNRGYLADRTRFEREFLPRGYLGTEEDERVLAGDLRMHQARVRYVVPGMDMEARVRALHEERQRLEEEAEREAKERRMQEEERERAWRDGRWFAAQQQGEWRWVEVDAKSGEVRANFKIPAQA